MSHSKPAPTVSDTIRPFTPEGHPSARDFGKLLALSALTLRQMRHQRRFTWWTRLSANERITTIAIVVGGSVMTISSLAWAAAASYIAHQRVRQVKLTGIGDEKVAAQEMLIEAAADNRDTVIASLSLAVTLEHVEKVGGSDSIFGDISTGTIMKHPHFLGS